MENSKTKPGHPCLELADEYRQTEEEYLDWPALFLWKIPDVPRKSVIAPNWENDILIAMQSLVDTLHSKWQEASRLEGLEREIILIKERINILESTNSTIIRLETFDPEPYKLLKPINVLIRCSGDEYIASFYDANLSASGDTVEEAYDNLKNIIISYFNILNRHKENELGPGPLMQKKVLNHFMREK